jgi:hypothetical protein
MVPLLVLSVVARRAHCARRTHARLSGTGSSGATIRLYIEQFTDDKTRLKEDAQQALADIIKVRHSAHACVCMWCVPGPAVSCCVAPHAGVVHCLLLLLLLLLTTTSRHGPPTKSPHALSIRQHTPHQVALELSKLTEFTGRDKPTVIT